MPSLLRARRRMVVAAVSLLLHGTGLAQTEPAPSQIPNGPYRIAGTLVDAKSGSPLARARVQIVEAKNFQNTQSVVSSDDGHFEFHAPAGKFGLQADKRGYIATAYNRHDQFSTAIVTGADLDTESLILRISPSAVLTGRVLDEHGDPVRNAQVMVYREDHFSGISRIRAVQGAATDDQGAYEATDLDEGTYFVSVKASPWYEIHPASSPDGTPSAQVDPSLDVAYPTTYYGDATESDDATPIPIRGGDHLEADIHLNPVPALHLIYRVAEGAQVMLPQLEKQSFDGPDSVQTRAQTVSDGVYEITGVPAGSYMVRMPDSTGQWKEPTALNLSSSQELDASSGNSTAKVHFKVEVAGAATLPQIQVGLRNSKGRFAGAQVDAKGEADFNDVIPGKYDVLAGSQTEVYSVTRMAWEGGATSGRTLTVPAGASLSVSLTLLGGSATVEGFAKRAGKASPGAMVVLVPKDPDANHDRFRRDQSDLDGSFSLPNVSPGSYTVIAIENGWDLDWAKPAVLSRYSHHGQTLVVPERTRSTIHLPKPVEVEPR